MEGEISHWGLDNWVGDWGLYSGKISGDKATYEMPYNWRSNVCGPKLTCQTPHIIVLAVGWNRRLSHPIGDCEP